jgi:hypothetical protein
MRTIPGSATRWALAGMLLLPASFARAQEAPADAQSAQVPVSAQTAEEADREALRRFLGREDVQRVARLADVDVAAASAGVLALDGARLSRAADQARALESRMGADDSITISSSTLIIVLLLILLILVVAS